MPVANGNKWRHCRAQLGITSDEAGKLLGITGGALRSIETEFRPASLALAYRAARLYSVSVDELIRDDERKPEPKPEKDPQPKVEPTAPPPRRNGDDNRKGPRRASSVEAGAA